MARAVSQAGKLSLVLRAFIVPPSRRLAAGSRVLTPKKRLIVCQANGPEVPVSRRTALVVGASIAGALVRPASAHGEQADAVAVCNTSEEGTIPISSLQKGCRTSVELLTGSDCDLGVSVYPNFVYNAQGGRGKGTALDQGDGRIAVNFENVDIPPVKFGTATFLGVPLPPPLRIDIEPESLEGFIEKETGKVELTFIARFFFSAGPLYRAPPLFVSTTLTTEHAQGSMRDGQGQRLDAEGRCRLAGVAEIPAVDDLFMSNFLMLPTDCLAVLPAQFKFSSIREA